MVSSFTPGYTLENPATGDLVNSWGLTENNGRSIVDQALSGVLAKSLAAGGTIILADAQGAVSDAKNAVFLFTGTLPANTVVLWPAARSRVFSVSNNTTGAFTVTLGVNNGSGAPAGSTVVVPQGETMELYSDGTNIAPRFNATAGPLAVNGALSVTGGATLGSPLPVASGGTGAATLAGAGIVSGPASATPGNIPTFADASGKVVQDSGTALAALVPSGTVLPFAGAAAPSGYLLCTGQAVSRATFAALFAVIGTAYGAGDGSTTFNVPDMRGRVPAGFDSGNATGRLTASTAQGVSAGALGNTGGEQAHALATVELAAHNHPISDPGHSHAFGPITAFVHAGGSGYTTFADTLVQTDFSSTSAATTGIATSNTGSGTAHNNVPPTIVLNYIIKT